MLSDTETEPESKIGQEQDCPQNFDTREVGAGACASYTTKYPYKSWRSDSSLSDELSNSWPSKKKFYRRRKGGNSVITQPRGGSRMGRLARPRTAVLKRPRVLDESLKDKLDMTLTKKQFLAAVKLVKNKMAFRQQEHLPRLD